MSDSLDLQALRQALEEVDREILRKLKNRMELVERVARVKLAAAIPFRDRLREEQVLGRVRQIATELGLDPYEIERLFRIVMDMSVSRQQSHLHSMENLPLRVAYQGVEGSPSHLDSQRRFRGRPGGALLSGHQGFKEVAGAVRSGQADLGVLPIEESKAGSINEVYDLLLEEGLTITAELFPIPNLANHYTRYVEISREALPCPPGISYKTSLVLVLDDRPGALREVLACLANHQLNLSKLESRPVPGLPLRYRFYVDLDGHSGSQEIESALTELRGIVADLRSLGTYPRGDVQSQVPSLPGA
jgi:prephenate dehydratase/chorismate mutase